MIFKNDTQIKAVQETGALVQSLQVGQYTRKANVLGSSDLIVYVLVMKRFCRLYLCLWQCFSNYKIILSSPLHDCNTLYSF